MTGKRLIMRVGYNIEINPVNSLPILPEKKITSFFDHTMEENSMDDEIVKNPTRKKAVRGDSDKVQEKNSL